MLTIGLCVFVGALLGSGALADHHGNVTAKEAYEMCKLAPDIGSCENYTVRWYFKDIYIPYDMYGSSRYCHRFWYGGCEGNRNNFESHKECLKLCEGECGKSPCKNGARCSNQIEGYNCTCLPGFTGVHCESNIDECRSSPCKNGYCKDLVNGYRCDCMLGYTGSHCETYIKNCSQSPCRNGGNCTDQENGYNCTSCAPGFTGTFCETDINDCALPRCWHGGMCLDLVNGYICFCPTGFTGTQCETNIDECASSPCLNGATCNDLANAYSCACTTGFTGTLCEMNMNE